MFEGSFSSRRRSAEVRDLLRASSDEAERNLSSMFKTLALSCSSTALSRASIFAVGGTPSIVATSSSLGATPHESAGEIFSKVINNPRTPRLGSLVSTSISADARESASPSCVATRTRCSASSLSVGLVSSNSTQRDLLVRSIFSGSVVASMNMTCGGGSSRSFKKAWPPSRDNPCASSMM